MSGVLLLAVPALAALVALPVVVVVLGRRSRPDHDLAAVAAAARRHAVLGGAAAALAGLLVLALGIGRAATPGSAPWPSTIPGLAALVALGVLALVELTWPRPTGTVRQVSLQPRSIRSVSGRRLPLTLLTTAAATAGVVLVGALLADASQRAITIVHDSPGVGEVTVTASPFPGLRYGLPALLAVGLLLLATLAGLHLVVVRPALPTDATTDDALRRASARRVLRAATAGALLTLGPLLVVGGITGASGDADGLALTAVGLGLGVVVAAVGVALWPAPSVPRPAPAATADTDPFAMPA